MSLPTDFPSCNVSASGRTSLGKRKYDYFMNFYNQERLSVRYTPSYNIDIITDTACHLKPTLHMHCDVTDFHLH